MKQLKKWVAGVLFLFGGAGISCAADWFVEPNGNDAADGATWATAKATLQSAIDAATDGNTVWVSNGVYAVGGGRVIGGTGTNRVAIDKAIVVQSVNGPETTFIAGDGMRCAYLTNGAVLSGFTLTNGFASEEGGGAWCEDGGVVTNCTLTGNQASQGGGARGGILNRCSLIGNRASEEGGGAYGGTLNHCRLIDNHASGMCGGGSRGATLNHCLLTGNRAPDGAGAAFGTLNNCTVAGNFADQYGGGAYFSALNNCIVFGNLAEIGNAANHSGCTNVHNTCTTPDPGGAGNLAADPRFANEEEDDYRLDSLSPCIDAGDNSLVCETTDLDGGARIVNGTVDMGAYEYVPMLAIYPASTNLLGEGASERILSVTARVPWGATTNRPWLAITSGDSGTTNGAVLFKVASNGGMTARTGAVVVTGGGISLTCTVIQAAGNERVDTWFVAANGNDAADGTTWATAKATLQSAIDAATDGNTVWVSNGVYAVGGGRVIGGTGTNRVAIDKAIVVQSVNGPETTFIAGDGMRCAYLTNGAVLSGFTLTNGFASEEGGGAWCEDGGVVTDCTLTGNQASQGGGARGGILNRCSLIGNRAEMEGGGAYGGTLNHCRLVGNRASGMCGGGSRGATLNHCLLIGNRALDGAGAAFGTLNNCTVAGNFADQYGGGAYFSALNNCIVFGNLAGEEEGNHFDCTLAYCCTTPDPEGIGNIEADPQFADVATGNYRLKTNSPCIDKGNNGTVQGTTDLDENPRIVNGTVDMGAYEVQILAGYEAWASAITNGLTNDTDCAAGDGVPNLLRYAAGSPDPMSSDDLARVGWDSSTRMPTLMFHRNPEATDITLFIEAADEIADGTTWRGVATNLNGSWNGATNVSESGTDKLVVVIAEDPVPIGTNRFLRLKVRRP